MPDKLPARIRPAVLARLRTGEAVHAVAEDLGAGIRLTLDGGAALA
ncbi:hypothetical protein [Streptomyces sp. NBC_01443]|nr:hypothetical protein [Streptomyces sp. NBC_01443]MCX4633393.1 hypothetical protein [Streptomyces sp. NBC_01443]